MVGPSCLRSRVNTERPKLYLVRMEDPQKPSSLKYSTPKKSGPILYTVCPRSSYPFYIITYYIKLVKISWTYSIVRLK